VSDCGAWLVTCAGRERGRESSTKGANEQGEVGERGTGSKRARACIGGRRTCGRGRVHGKGRGQEVRDRLTGGIREAERKSARVRKRNDTDWLAPQSSERERERGKGRAGWRRQVGLACRCLGPDRAPGVTP
jgi:hypothetical protein